MSIARTRFMAVGLALVGSGLAISLLNAQPGPPPAWVVGDVFVAIGDGKYEVRSSTGTLKQTITYTLSGSKKEVAGCWFDSQFNLYTADFNNTRVVKHALAGSHEQTLFADTNLQAPKGNSEGIAMAVNGDVFVGHEGDGTASRELLRYRSDGVFIDSYEPAIESGGVGIDWIDVSTNPRKVFFTSRGRDIRTFDVPSETTATFKTLAPGGQAHAIRLLGPSFNGDDGLLVADNGNIKELDGTGTEVATYDAPGEDTWQALNLAADGSFWAGGFATGKLYRFARGTGAVGPAAGPFQTAGAGELRGVCSLGGPQTQVQPVNLSNTSSSTQLIDVPVFFGDPDATGPEDFYSFNSWRARVRVKGNQTIIAALGFNPATTNFTCTTGDSNDFDCRFTQTPAQCEPFFRDPSAPNVLGAPPLGYRCAFYRLKDMPQCQASSPGTCPFDEPFIPGSNSIQGEVILDLTDPPSTVFDINALFGNSGKGNPRIMRAPGQSFQFFVDGTVAADPWPAVGSGYPNDYAPAHRVTSTAGGGCAQIIKPDGTGANSGSNMKLIVEVKTLTAPDGSCTGDPVTGASDPPNHMTVSVYGTGSNELIVVICETPGNSLGCFTPVNGQPGRYQSTFDLLPSLIPPDAANPYIFSVTSVPVLSENPATQVPGLFGPTQRQYFVCPSGGNCGS